MKRIKSLSAQRNTHIALSGGHGVISNTQAKPKTEQVRVTFPEGTKTAPLYLFPWVKELTQINTPKCQRITPISKYTKYRPTGPFLRF